MDAKGPAENATDASRRANWGQQSGVIWVKAERRCVDGRGSGVRWMMRPDLRMEIFIVRLRGDVDGFE